MTKIGLKVLIFAYLFWYGLGYLHPIVIANPVSFTVNITVITFFVVMVCAHKIGYSSKIKCLPQKIPYREYRVGSRTFVLLIMSLILVFCIYMFSQGQGMLGYHSLRAQIAMGILISVYIFLFKGWRRSILILIFLAIAVYALGVYSRRPFLTLIAPVLLIPLIRNRYTVNSKLIYSLAISLFAILGLLYVTGLRHLREELLYVNVLPLISRGFNVFISGEGFDTIHLTAYTFDSYDTSNYLYGQTFYGGFLNFIPRSLWEGKPIAFGITLSGQYFNLFIEDLFTNFGPGIVAEAYANGGFIAIFIVAALLGWLVGLADITIENNRYNWNYVLFGVVLYPALFFMIRGDFLNSYYEFYSKALVIWLICMITGIRHRLRPRAYI